MKTEKTYPNIFWIAPQLLVSLPLLWIALAVLSDTFGFSIHFLRIYSTEHFMSNTEDRLYGIAFGFFVAGYGLHMLWGLSIRWCTVVLSDEGFTYVKPLRLRKKTIPWNNILGFSASQMCQYRDISGQSALWCSDSIVIYESGGEVIEVIDIHNFRFNIIEKILRQKEVNYLGFEQHEESFFGIRRYKYPNDEI